MRASTEGSRGSCSRLQIERTDFPKRGIIVLDRIVSLGSALVVAFSVVLFAMALWWTLVGRIGEGDGFLILAGSLLAAIVFTYRATDSRWLDPISIVKR